MEKYNLTEANESLNRVLLLMNYDNSKTLSENEIIKEDGILDVAAATPFGAPVAGGIAGYKIGGQMYDYLTKKPIGGESKNTQFVLNKTVDFENTESQRPELKLFSGTKFVLKFTKDNKPYLITDKPVTAQYTASDTGRVYGDSLDNKSEVGMKNKAYVIYSCTKGKFKTKKNTIVKDISGFYGNPEKYTWYDDGEGVSPELQKICKLKIEKVGGGGTGEEKPTITLKYKNCIGTYKLYCKSDTIKKVQKCLGIVADGMFGPKTEKTIQNKLGKKEFTDSDVEKICQTEIITTTTTTVKPEMLKLPTLSLQQSAQQLKGIKSNLPQELQTKGVKFSREPIFGATTLESACGNETLNDKFRACKRKFGRIMKISNVEMNESIKPLELIIHEALLKKTKTKKKINENFVNFKNILSESNDNIVEDFISEVNFLLESGFDSMTISEGLGDLLGSILGKSGGGITQYFKVKFANWFLERLHIADPDSWVGEIISQVFAQIDIKDYGRFISDCDFASEKISHALADSAAAHFLKQKGFDNAISGILLQSASEALFSNEFIKTLQENLGKLICPLFGQVSSKVKSVVTGATA